MKPSELKKIGRKQKELNPRLYRGLSDEDVGQAYVNLHPQPTALATIPKKPSRTDRMLASVEAGNDDADMFSTFLKRKTMETQAKALRAEESKINGLRSVLAEKDFLIHQELTNKHEPEHIELKHQAVLAETRKKIAEQQHEKRHFDLGYSVGAWETLKLTETQTQAQIILKEVEARLQVQTHEQLAAIDLKKLDDQKATEIKYLLEAKRIQNELLGEADTRERVGRDGENPKHNRNRKKGRAKPTEQPSAEGNGSRS